MSRRPKQTFLQRRYTDGQEAHEKIFNITMYQRNTNQNYSYQFDWLSLKVYKQEMLEKVWTEGHPPTLFMYIATPL